MNSQKQKKHSVLKRAITVAVMSSVCLTAAIGVATFTQTVTVSDVTTDVAETTEETNETSFTEASVSDSMLNAFKVENEETIVENSIAFNLKENEKGALAEYADASDEEIRIENWCAITVNLRGKNLNKDVPAGTVSDAFSYLGIKLTENDNVDKEMTEAVEDGMTITVKRVVYTESEKTEAIDYNVVTKATSMLYQGETQVETEGEQGERKITYKSTWVNGKLTEKVEIKNEVVKEAVDKVVLNGTAVRETPKPLAQQIEENGSDTTVNESENTITDSNGNVLHYSYCLSGPTTAYTAEAGASTSTGRLARYGVVAVDPSEIPYGSILYIVSDDGFEYGYAVAGDTGGFIYYTDVVVDLYFPTLDDCSVYGLRNASVYVLEGMSENVTY